MLDEAVADRDSGAQRHLLGGDRADEHLEGIGCERRSKALELQSRGAEHVIGGRPGIKRVEVEGEPEHRSCDGLRLGVEWLDVDSTGRRLNPHFASADGAVEPALVPHRRPVDPERAKALGCEREIEWPGHGEERHARTVSGAQPFEPAAVCVRLDAAWSSAESLLAELESPELLPSSQSCSFWITLCRWLSTRV